MQTKIKSTSVGRQSNFELLRILAMLSIVCYHFICHAAVAQISSMAVDTPWFSIRLVLYQFVSTFGTTGNAIFILITGYFLISAQKLNITKQISKVFAQLFFGTCILLLLVFVFYFFNNGSSFSFIPEILKNAQSTEAYGAITISGVNSNSWFLGYYICIVAVAHFFLNKWLNKVTQSQYLTALACVAALNTFSFIIGLFNNISGNLTLAIAGLLFYMVGGYIRLYNPLKRVRTIAIIAVIAMMYLLWFISFYNNTMSNIAKFENGLSETFAQSIFGPENNSILVIIIAISIFELFKRINIGNIKIINFISSATLMIYIIHDHEFAYSLYRLIDWQIIFRLSPVKVVLVIAVGAFAIYLFGFSVYLLYLLTGKLAKGIKKVAVKPELK